MRVWAVLVVAALGVMCLLLAGPPAAGRNRLDGTVPVTTSSEPARREYLAGRELEERLRLTDAYAYYAKAAELDPGFALAHYGLAVTAPSPGVFFASLKDAVALADRASRGEEHMIRALEATANGQPEAALEHLTALVQAHPFDERAHTLLGDYLSGRQEWLAAAAQYRKAAAINPHFAQAYNQLGHALRALERYREAEQAYRQYAGLLPGEPNPYDSWAELLMKTGRFTESITVYEKALAIRESFVPSLVGIANDEIFLGRPHAARLTLGRLAGIARNDGERRQACLWTAVTYIHEGDARSALSEVDRCHEIAARSDDRVAMAADLNFSGNILLEAGRLDAALAKFREGVATVEGSNATSEAKEATRRNLLYDSARVALAGRDLNGAGAAARAYSNQADARKIPFEVWRAHELTGLVALAAGDAVGAVRELALANQQDPRVLFALGQAHAAAGASDAARQAFTRAADFNAPSISYAWVRTRALARLRR